MLYSTVTLQNKLTMSIGLIYLLRPYFFFLTSGLFFLFLLLLLMLRVIYYPPPHPPEGYAICPSKKMYLLIPGCTLKTFPVYLRSKAEIRDED